jgi:hypothetical protein
MAMERLQQEEANLQISSSSGFSSIADRKKATVSALDARINSVEKQAKTQNNGITNYFNRFYIV